MSLLPNEIDHIWYLTSLSLTLSVFTVTNTNIVSSLVNTFINSFPTKYLHLKTTLFILVNFSFNRDSRCQQQSRPILYWNV